VIAGSRALCVFSDICAARGHSTVHNILLSHSGTGSLITGASTSSLPSDSPLRCLLNNLDTLGLTPDIKPKNLTCFCTQIWLTYALDNQSHWPLFGSLDRNLLRDLYNYCERLGQWGEIPYVQAFSYLRLNPALCTTCKPKHVLLALKPSASTCALSLEFDPADEPPPYHWQAPPDPPPPQPTTPSFNLPPLPASSSPSASPPLAPTSPSTPIPPSSPTFSPPTTRSCTLAAQPPTPSLLAPLWEVAGSEGIVRVHVPSLCSSSPKLKPAWAPTQLTPLCQTISIFTPVLQPDLP
jgi:hypothetical protein